MLVIVGLAAAIVSMSANEVLAIDEYTLTVNIVGHGSVNIIPTQLHYSYGTTVDLYETRDDGWNFYGWTGDTPSGSLYGGDPLTITMTQDKVVNANFGRAQSCDVTGAFQNVFNSGESIYVTSAGWLPVRQCLAFIVPDVDNWEALNGQPIPTPVSGTTGVSVSIDDNGHISPTLLWASPLPGKYDIVIDIDNNGIYNSGVDPIADNNVVTTAGLFVVPEYLFGSLGAIGACLTGFIIFKKRGKLPHIRSS
jgi:hypothetical protein